MVRFVKSSEEQALYDVPPYREFAGVDGAMNRLPEETTILRFRHLLESHGIAAQILAVVNEILSDKGLMFKARSPVDATLVAAPSSTKNGLGTRDPACSRPGKAATGILAWKHRGAWT